MPAAPTFERTTVNARTEARLAAVWAAWAVAIAEDTLADFDAGDPGTFLARFPGRPSGMLAGLSEDAIGGWMAEGVQLAPYSCAPDGIVSLQLTVACEVTGTDVPDLAGLWRLHVGPDGLVAHLTIDPT